MFAALDGAYLSSALTKVPDGAWFTLLIAVLLSSLFVLWRFGKENQWRAEAEDVKKLGELVTYAAKSAEFEGKDGTKDARRSPDAALLHLTPALGGGPIALIPGIGIFFDKSGLPNTTPTVFIHFLHKFRAAPRIVVFFHIRTLSLPTVAPEDRFTVFRCLKDIGGDGEQSHSFFRVMLRHGYMDDVVNTELGVQIYEELRKFVIREGDVATGRGPQKVAFTGDPAAAATNVAPTKGDDEIEIDSSDSSGIANAISNNHTPEYQAQSHVHTHLRTLQAAHSDQTVYIVGKETMKIRHPETERRGPCAAVRGRWVVGGGWARRLALAAFLWIRANSGSKVGNWDVDVGRLVEVGFVKVV